MTVGENASGFGPVGVVSVPGGGRTMLLRDAKGTDP